MKVILAAIGVWTAFLLALIWVAGKAAEKDQKWGS